MKNFDITPVILCGGHGTRLWPLSRKSFPKQFVPLIKGKSLLEHTLERVARLNPGALPQTWCIAAEDHRFLVMNALQAAGLNGRVILEPAARNTAAAMGLAAWHAQPEDLLLFCPSDHHIPDAEAFAAMVRQGCPAAAAGAIVTFGVVPSFPSTAYGYIQRGALLGDGPTSEVLRFIEKPDADEAQRLLLQGDVLWNAGIFLVQAGTLKAALALHAPDIYKSCQQAMAGATEDGNFVRPEAAAFLACRAESIDYAVLEHHDQVVVVPFAGAWSDVGSWNAVAALSPPDAQGNRIDGQGVVVQGSNNYIHAEHRPVVALGTQDLLIIDTPDALLVANRSHAEAVKQVVALLEDRDMPQAVLHRKVERPWGNYDSVDVGARYQVKRITVRPGARLSLQMHYHRAEHWIVVKGTALITRGEEEILLTENQSTFIPLGVKHRLQNPGKTELELIEVQSGGYLGEDDIVRFEDTYGRVATLPVVA